MTINPASLPDITDLYQQSTHQPQAGSFVGDNSHHSGPAADFLTHLLKTIGRADPRQ